MQMKVFHGALKHMLINYYDVLIIKQEKRELISFFFYYNLFLNNINF